MLEGFPLSFLPSSLREADNYSKKRITAIYTLEPQVKSQQDSLNSSAFQST